MTRSARLRRAGERVARVRLTARQRQCVVLAYFDGLTRGEIAGQLGLSTRAVRQVMHRARKKLAKAGLKATRVEVVPQHTLLLMSPDRIDRLPLDKIRGRW